MWRNKFPREIHIFLVDHVNFWQKNHAWKNIVNVIISTPADILNLSKRLEQNKTSIDICMLANNIIIRVTRFNTDQAFQWFRSSLHLLLYRRSLQPIIEIAYSRFIRAEKIASLRLSHNMCIVRVAFASWDNFFLHSKLSCRCSREPSRAVTQACKYVHTRSSRREVRFSFPLAESTKAASILENKRSWWINWSRRPELTGSTRQLLTLGLVHFRRSDEPKRKPVGH